MKIEPNQIVWIKHITNIVADDATAYLDIESDEFILDFPAIAETNIRSPQIGEVILLFQKISRIRYFTHLVTPADYEVIKRPSNDYPHGRKMKLIAITKNPTIEVSNTVWGKLNFAPISNGNFCRIENIQQIINADIYRMKEDIISRFKDSFVESISNSSDFQQIAGSVNNEFEINYSGTEGNLKLIQHLAYERDARLVKTKKENALQQSKLFCEVCGFDFKKTYGFDFIECHHNIPMSSGIVRETSLDDLSLVCANCHRMLHQRFKNKYLTVLELKEKIK